MQADGAVDVVRGLVLEELEEPANVVPHGGSLDGAVDCFENSAGDVSVGMGRQSAALLIGDQLGPGEEPSFDGAGENDGLGADETGMLVQSRLLLPGAGNQVW